MAIEPPPKPIVSLLSDDPDPRVEERIDRFVVQLGERIDGFQDLEAVVDFENLGAELARFAEQSDELGYPPLAEIARRGMEAGRADAGQDVRKAVVDLTELAARVRRGHRSSA